MVHCRALSLGLIAAAVCAALPAVAAEGDDFKYENKADNLKVLFQRIHKAAHVEKDGKKAAALFTALIPDESRLKKALKDDVPAATLRAIGAQHKQFRQQMTAANAAKIATAKQSVVKVYEATTEGLAKYEKGGTAYTHFPQGAQRMAKDVLRPKVTFYEVAFLEPGKDRGMKYHLFYWDGKQWSMLGPTWRAVK